MVESITPPKQLRDSHEFASLLAVVGFACFWAWIAVIILGGPFGSMGGLDSFDKLLVRFVALAAFAAVQYVTYKWMVGRLTSATSSRLLPLFVLALAIPVPAISSGGSIPSSIALAVGILAWLCAGVSAGILMLLWGNIWSTLDGDQADNRTSAIILAVSALFVPVLCLFLVFAPKGIALVAGYALYVASTVLFVICSSRLPTPTQIDAETSLRRLKLYSRSRFTPITAGVALGIVLGISVGTFGSEDSFVLLLVAIAFGSIAAGAVLVMHKQVPKISSVERITFPVLGAGLLLLPFVSGGGRWLVVLVILADLIAYLIFHWNVLVALSYRYHVLPIYHFAQGEVSPLGGLAAGWGVETILAGLGIPSSGSILATSLILVFVLIVEPAFVPYTSDKTVELTDRSDRPKKTLTDESGGYWRKRCARVSEDHGLTPRENEVFVLLARGRNTEVISRELFISTHTVKTHVYRIYRKLNVGTQQELINTVEHTRLDE
ncbi:MAG: helix-turn-helix transcriptional regulator [Coriobacteriia bacterium]|nr:helix-turn-helix transcriptional regulator [Coriobacteriia bacterium]